MVNFKAILAELEKIENYISDSDFQTACDMLKGWNNDGELFDFAWATEKVDFIATIHNHDVKPVIESGSFLEIYDGDELPCLTLSRDEIREQVERLGINE